jgi:hypothetical protein
MYEGLRRGIDAVRIPIGANYVLAAIAAGAVFLAQYYGFDRRMLLSPSVVLGLQILLGLGAFVLVAGSSVPARSALFVIAACYAYVVGIPLLIAIPLGIVMGAIKIGSMPLYLSTLLVPAAMLAYYYVAPSTFQRSETANLLLAAVALLPMFTGIMLTRKLSGAREIASRMLRAALAVLPVWFAVSFSSNHITDVTAFSIVVFWMFVPLLNGIWDAISWWLTWHLLAHLRGSLASLSGEATSGALQRAWVVGRGLATLFWHVALNFVVSLAILVLTFVSIMAALSLVNRLILPVHPSYAMDLDAILRAVRDAPYSGDGLWLLLTVLAALIPAIVHLAIVFFSGLAIAFGTSHGARAWSVLVKGPQELTEAEAGGAIRVAALHFAVSTFFFVVCLAAAISIYHGYVETLGVGELLHAIGTRAVKSADLVMAR